MHYKNKCIYCACSNYLCCKLNLGRCVFCQGEIVSEIAAVIVMFAGHDAAFVCHFCFNSSQWRSETPQRTTHTHTHTHTNHNDLLNVTRYVYTRNVHWLSLKNMTQAPVSCKKTKTLCAHILFICESALLGVVFAHCHGWLTELIVFPE